MPIPIKSVPFKIKEHLISENALFELDLIYEKAGIYDKAIIPGIIFRLITKETTAHDFLPEIIEHFGDSERARAIAKEVKEKILEPINYSLLSWEVDINNIKLEEEPTLDEIMERQKKWLEEIMKTPTTTELKINKGRGKAEEGRPLVIHKAEKKNEDKVKGFKGFNPLGALKSVAKTNEEKKEVRAEIESPKTEKKNIFSKKITKKNNPPIKRGGRTVHYSEYHTPLNPIEFMGPEKINKKEEIKHDLKKDGTEEI